MRRLLHLLRERFPLTLPGLLLLLGGALGFALYGLGEKDQLLLVIGGLAMALVLLSGILVVLAALWLWRRLRQLPPGGTLEMECGRPGHNNFVLGLPWWMPLVHLDWTWLEPGVELSLERDKRGLRERVVPQRRGRIRLIRRRFVVGDVLGLAAVALEHRQEVALRILPSVGALGNLHVVQGMAGGDQLGHPQGDPVGDRMDMRRYGEGDPIRFVMWKVYARTRQLMVRDYERALSPTRQTVAYLVSTQGDQAAAGAVRVAIDGGALGGDWTLAADGVEGEARARTEALDLVIRSGDAPPEAEGRGLGPFLASRARGISRRAVIFVPPRPGPWLDHVVAAAQSVAGTGVVLDFVVGTDGVLPQGQRNAAGRLMLPGPAPKPTTCTRDELSQVLRKLAGLQGRILVVDRQAGTVTDAGLLHERLGA